MKHTACKLFRDILTGIDGKTYDNGRVMCTLSYLVYFIMALWSMTHHSPWTPLDFSAGVGTMAVGFGVNLHLKKGTEPDHERQSN